jgi:Tfp pilus assembly protein PilP
MEFVFVKVLSKKTLETKKKIEHSNSVAINVRRGDYLRHDYAKIFGNLDIDYYLRAVELIQTKIQEPLFFVFSDDPKWVKENFNLQNIIFVGNDEFKDYEQLYLMTQCKHNIVANSSFAWWGAWLGINDGKIVIVPKYWTRKKKNTKDVCPESWIRLENSFY